MTASRFIIAGPIRIEPLEREIAVRLPSGEFKLVHLGPKGYLFIEMLAGRLDHWVSQRHIAEALYMATKLSSAQKSSACTIAANACAKIVHMCPAAQTHLLKRFKLGYMLRT